MKTEEWLEKAKVYFNGDMSIEDAQHFRNETAASEELSALMQLWLATDKEGVLYENDSEQKEALISTHQKLRGEFSNDRRKGKQIKHVKWRWVAIAAAVAGIVILMKVVAPFTSENSMIAEQKENDDSGKLAKHDSSVPANTKNLKVSIQPHTLFSKNFTADEVPEDPNGPLDDAFFYYASRQYKQAITAIDSLHNKSLTRGAGSLGPVTKFYAQYYKALSFLSLGNGADALPLLEQSVSDAPSPLLKAKSQWYLALTYLSMNNTASAINVLEQLNESRSSGSYKQKAGNLLTEVKK